MRSSKFEFWILSGFLALTFSGYVYGENTPSSNRMSAPEIEIFERPPLVKNIDKELEKMHTGELKGPNVKLTIISTWKETKKYVVNMSMKNLNKEQGYRTIYLLSYDSDGRIVDVSSDRKYFKPYQEYFKQYKFTKSSSIIRWRFYVK